jgi:NAD(P)-dependent dehydrogenase (short-subunit alcohol dehydrogenase family)
MNDGPLLAGKVAVVSGGSRGIGRAIVQAFAAEGADVAFSYRSDAKSAQEVVRAVEHLGRRAVAIPSDARRPEEAARFVEAAVAAVGPLDIVVANAGVAPGAAGEEIPLEVWREALETNLVGAHALVMAARARFHDGAGSVVLISSISALLPYARNLPYASSKAGLLVLARSLAIDLAPKVRINAVAPGWVRTDLNVALHSNSASHDRIVKRIPRGRWGEPDDVAAAVVFLASDGARFITGQTVVVDGGNSIYWTAGVEG